MGLMRILAADATARLAEFDAVIDARSEDEFADDHLPGAVNWPSLNNAERARVGTQYTQVSPFEARKQGAVLVARNIARHVETHLSAVPRTWRPLIYCWRGGQRSGALATVLDQIGFAVGVVEGGYRAFRRSVVADLEQLPQALSWRTVIGRTGSAKSRLLQALQVQGEQVLDLEALACHKGSVLGPLPGQPQPSQKRFDTLVWSALRQFQPDRPVYIEGESRTIGRLRVPERLLEALRAAPCLDVAMPLPQRVDFLLQDYGHFVTDVESFCERLNALREVRGHALVNHWQTEARAQRLHGVVEALLTEHYDPVYLRSMQRNFRQFGQARILALADGHNATLQAAASQLVQAAAASEPRPADPGCR
jgi:tRNA 2-selenouridine synthase